METKILVMYGGRVGGAVAAYYLVGKGTGVVGAVASIALGWLAGGVVSDAIANATMLGLDLR